MNAWFYGRGDLYDMAAAYAFHIAEAQAFLMATSAPLPPRLWRFLGRMVNLCWQTMGRSIVP